MKNVLRISFITLLLVGLFSCDTDDSVLLEDSVLVTAGNGSDEPIDNNGSTDEPNYEVPSPEDIDMLIDQALEDHTQHFEIGANDGNISLSSAHGVVISINTDCFSRADGTAMEGNIDLKFIEVFDKGSMLGLNKPTMGAMGSDKALLISGGEFYLNASNDGHELTLSCGFNLNVPGGLTGGVDAGMSLWNGVLDAEDNLVWNEDDDNDKRGIFNEGESYYLGPLGFGWTNIDKFYSDPRPKTTILVDVPAGYDNENSMVYVSFNDQTSSLAQLDVYDDVTELFSEHYGQIPIGLECNLIFMTEENDEYRYAIKPLTIAANDTISVNYNETVTGTLAQLKQAINNLP